MSDVQRRHERVHLETLRHRITGNVTLTPNGYRSRLSDQLNATERDFIVLTDVTVEPIDGGAPTQHQFIAVARQQIIFVLSLGEDGPAGSPPGAPPR